MERKKSNRNFNRTALLATTAAVSLFAIACLQTPLSHAQDIQGSEPAFSIHPPLKDVQISAQAGKTIELHLRARPSRKTKMTDPRATGIVETVGELPEGANLEKYSRGTGDASKERYIFTWTPTPAQAGRNYSIMFVAKDKRTASGGTPETMVVRVASALVLPLANSQSTGVTSDEAGVETVESKSVEPALSQSPLIVIIDEDQPVYDVILKHEGVADKTYGPAANDMERCDLIRKAVKDAEPRDTILLGEGRFDCDGPNKGTVLFPEEVTVMGKGVDKTKLFSVMLGDDQGLGFEVRGGRYQDLAFEVQSANQYEDARTIGMWEGLAKTEDGKRYLRDASGKNVVIDPTPGPWTIVMERVRMIGNDWVWYHWNNQQHHFKFVGCEFISGRQGISFMTNNVGWTFTAEIIDSKFDIDTSRSASIGWTSNRTHGGGYGIVVRGGNGTKIINSTFNLKCGVTGHPSSYVPRCAALYDGNGFGSASGAASIEWVDNNSKVNGNGSPESFDIFMTNEGTQEKLQLSRGCGSGPACLITKNWSNPIDLLRAELVERINTEETAANAALADLNQQLEQLKTELETSNEKIKVESTIWRNRLKAIISILQKVIEKPRVSAGTKTAALDFISRMNSYLDPANPNGLEQKTEAYITALTAANLAPLNAQIGSWNQYLKDLQTYRYQVVAAATLEQLKILEKEFPLRWEFPVPGMPFLPDPREEAEQFFMEGRNWLVKANAEASTLPDPYVIRVTDTMVQIEINAGDIPDDNRLILNVLEAGQIEMREACSSCDGGCGVFTATMEELKPATTYQFLVQMVNVQGTVIAKSRTLSFTTVTAIALGEPAVTDLTDTTAQVRVSAAKPDAYLLTLQLADGQKVPMSEVACGCNTCGRFRGTFTNLKPGVTYQYTAQIADPNGNIVRQSQVSSFTTVSPVKLEDNRVIEEGVGLNIKLHASDPNRSGLKFQAVELPLNAGFDAGTGIFFWTPELGDRSTHTAVFLVTDASGAQFNEKINITVIAKNEDEIPTHHDHFPNLASDPSTVATKNGLWSDPDIWSKAIVPVDGDTVRIPPGIQVIYDVVSDAALSAIGLNGHLKFATGLNTKLKVGDLLIFSDGHLEIGNEQNPIREHVNAEVTVADKALDVGTPTQPGRDPKQYGTGVNVFGKLTVHGARKSATWMRVAQEMHAGDTEIVLENAVSGWHAGDTIVIPDTRQVPITQGDNFRRGTFPQQWEEIKIKDVQDNRIILAEPLHFDHLGARDANGNLKFLPHVALLDRNVMFRSEEPDETKPRYCKSEELDNASCKTRGHMLFTDRADTDIRYARFYELGRTDSFKPLDNTKTNSDGTLHIGTNQIARYAVHWHHCMGPRREGADRYDPEVYQFKFIGNTVDRATKWAVTIHGTSFGLVTDNVVYRAQGAGIVTEEGDEIENQILRNFVMRMRGTNSDGRTGVEEADYKSGNYGNGGTGFWFRRSGNIVKGNVVANVSWASYVMTSYYLATLAELKEKMIITPRFRGANRMNHMHEPDEGDYLLINPNGEFSDNEAYGTTPNALWLAYLRGFEIHGDWIKDIDNDPTNGLQPMEPLVIKDSNFWHIHSFGVIAWHTTRITYDHLTFLSDVNAIKDYPTAGNTGYDLVKYENLYTRIINNDIEGYKIGILPSVREASRIGDRNEDAEQIGEVIQDSRLKNFFNIAISPPYQYRNALTIKNVRFEELKIISTSGAEERFWPGGGRVNLPGDPRNGTPITYSPKNIIMGPPLSLGSMPSDNDSAPADMAARHFIRVIDYNGVKGDDFELFHKDAAPSVVIPKTQFNPGHRFSTKFLLTPEEGLTNAQSFTKYGIAVGGSPASCTDTASRPEIDAITCNLIPGQVSNVPVPNAPSFSFLTPWNGAVITPVENYRPLPMHFTVSEGFPSDLRIRFQLDKRNIREYGEPDMFYSGLEDGPHTLAGWLADADGNEIPGTRKTVTFLYGDTGHDIMLKSAQPGGDKYYGPAANDLERGNLLRQAVKDMKAGDTLVLGEGRFDMDCRYKGNLIFPDQINVMGHGMDKTHLFGNCWSDDQSSAFEVRNGNYSDLTFENQSWQIFEDGRTIEMYAGLKRTPDNVSYAKDDKGHKIVEVPNPGPFTATFDRVKFIGNAWTVYDWSGRGHHWIIRDSVVVSGRQGVSMMSGGGNFANADVLRTKFDIDTMRSRDIGWTSLQYVGGAFAVVARGGHVNVEDSEFHMKCGGTPQNGSYASWCVGVFDGNNFGSSSSAWTYINLTNNRWFIDGDANGSQSQNNGDLSGTYDILVTNAGAKEKLQISGGCGSGPNCEITAGSAYKGKWE